jgi:hypothetical protein
LALQGQGLGSGRGALEVGEFEGGLALHRCRPGLSVRVSGRPPGVAELAVGAAAGTQAGPKARNGGRHIFRHRRALGTELESAPLDPKGFF